MKLRMVGGRVLGQGVSVKAGRDGTTTVGAVDPAREAAKAKAVARRRAANRAARRTRKGR